MSTPNAPQLVIWLLTARCTQSCLHCYASRFPKQGNLDEKRSFDLLNEMAAFGVNHVGFSGGSIFLRDDSLRLIEHAYRSGITTSIVTSGLDITDEIAEQLANCGTFLFLSIDGPNRKTYERLRGSGSWDYVTGAVEKLRKFSVGFATVMALNKLNWTEAPDCLSLAKDLGATAGCFIPVMPAGRASMDLILQPEELMSTLQKIDKKAEELQFPVSLWCMPFAGLVVQSNFVHYDFCRTYDEMDLDPQGNVLLCDVLDTRPSSVGNKPLSQAWEEQQESQIVKSVIEPELASPCLDCPFRDKCRGGCFARAQLMSGNIHAPDPLCPKVAGLI